MRRTALALMMVAQAAAVAGCREPARPAVDPRAIEIAGDAVAIRTGSVGEGKWRGQATYALVEARNRGDQDLMVTLGGELRAEAGAAAWPLARESLRIPAGGSRLFALVDAARAARPQASAAHVELAGAMPVRYAPPFAVKDGNVVLDQDRAVAAGNIVNTAARDGSAVVIGAFFDQAGAPLERTSTVFPISSGGARGVRLVGPPGSRSAYLFIGEVEY
ncbi:MAG TPA: hypothetical protein VK698_23860 [Kofleriaceae bacterium]|nr:hypothetical protein [Kofleriaceae bacterium]